MREYKEYLQRNSRQTHTRHRRGGKRLLAFVLSLCMAAAAAPLPAAANTAETKNVGVSESNGGLLGTGPANGWDGSIAENFANAGTQNAGTESVPYEISSAAQLAYLAKGVNEGTVQTSGTYFKLTTDINLNGKPWTPIGLNEKGKKFEGIFDGDGHTISGLNVTRQDGRNGLFGCCEDATIKNLSVGGTINISGAADNAYAGGVCGYASDMCTFQNCSSSAEITIAYEGSETPWFYAGGICGNVASGCEFDACSNSGAVSVSVPADTGALGYAGGICGSMSMDNALTACRNTGRIRVSGKNQTASLKNLAGGICGLNIGSALTGCCNEGVLEVTGAAGANDAEVCAIANEDSDFGVMVTGSVYLDTCIAGLSPENLKAAIGMPMTQTQINSGAAAGYMNAALNTKSAEYRWCQDLNGSGQTLSAQSAAGNTPADVVYPSSPCLLGGSNTQGQSVPHGTSLIYTGSYASPSMKVNVGCACGANDSSYGSFTVTLDVPTDLDYDGTEKTVTVRTDTSGITKSEIAPIVNAAVSAAAVRYYKTQNHTDVEQLPGAPKDAGEYRAEFLLSGVDGRSVKNDVRFTIAQATTQLSVSADNVTKVFGDSAFPLGVTVPPADAQVAYAVRESDPCVSVSADGTVTILKAGTATVDVSVAEPSNYKAASQSVTITVNKKSGFSASVPEQSVEAGSAGGQIDQSQYLPSDCGAVTYGTPVTSGAIVSGAAVSADGKLSYTLKGGAAGDTGTVSVTVQTANYEDFTLSVLIRLTAKPGSGGSSSGGSSSGNSSGSGTVTPSKPAAEPENREPQIMGGNGATGWDAIREVIRDAKTGDTVTLQMNGALTVPGKVLKSIKGKNVNVVFEMNEKLSLAINGRDLRGFTFKNKNDYSVLFLWTVSSMARLIHSIGA